MSSASKKFIEESQLIKELSHGKPSAFEFVVREYGGYLLNVARQYIKDSGDAQDIVQESYLQLFKNISSFRGDSSLKSWLHRITVNNALMRIRSDSKTPVILSEPQSDTDNFDENGKRLESAQNISISADEVYSNAELQTKIRQHIMTLPPAYRNILLLRDIEGYSISETSELLNISTSSVKTGLHRARNKLKMQLEHIEH